MMLMLDLMGQRYGKLPSEVLASGDTMDMIIAITALEYEKWAQKKKSQGKVPTHMSQEEMQARIDRANAKSGQK
jgi:hypothetical protein